MGEGSALREVLAVFDISANTEELDKAHKKIEGFKDKLLSLVKVGMEAFAVDAVREFVKSQVEVATELERTAVRLGLTTSQLEKYDLAAGLAGVSAEAMSNGLRFLSRNIGEAVTKGGEAAGAFGKLHIALTENGKTRDTGKVLEELADHFKNVQDPAKRTQLAMELFGRQGAALIPILNKGSEAFREAESAMRELGGPTTEAQIESAKRVEVAQTRLTFAWNKLKMAIAEHLFPVFETLVRWGTKVVTTILDLNAHTGFFSTSLMFLGGFAAFKAISGITALMKSFGLLKPSVLETIGALFEFLGPVIVVVGLYLAFDDLFGLMTDKKSLIGETVDAFFGLGAAADLAEALRASFLGLYVVLLEIKNLFWELPKAIGYSIVDAASGDWAAAGKDWKRFGHQAADPLNATQDEEDEDENAAEDKTTQDIKNMYARRRLEKADKGERRAHPGKRGADTHSAASLEKADKDAHARIKEALWPQMQARQAQIRGRHDQRMGRQHAEEAAEHAAWAKEYPNLAAEQAAGPQGYVRAFPTAGQHGAGDAARSLVQSIRNEIHITAADNPAAHGRAAAKGVKEGMDRSNDKASQTKS